MITLHHAPRSRSSRIIWLLEELGAPYELKLTTIPRMDGSGGPDAKNPHPDKKVPAIVHDGALVTESAAIVAYLADLYPETGIAPKVGDPRRGPYLTWLAYYAGVIEPVINISVAGLAEQPTLKRTFTGRDAVDRRILEALQKGPYILGEDFTGADILIASMGLWAREMLPKDALVDAYLKRCMSRPALARAGARDEG